ncbi:G-protein coupled receptor 1 [Ornithorhynchus anatinus]|uniref:Chemerin-like receptor 2 n=1 Tax=Ornithorhynchus anatinus TaxID=9258 RepID=F6QIU0_ORNAN|nr:G-protein coupled receptor 1 [Ornithorhynchus anatinus]XP_007670852.1 G-protein coupled receptor 1 [Ornithorhynchus anatinus]
MEDLEALIFEDVENYSYTLEYYGEVDQEETAHLTAVHSVSLVLYCVAFILGVPGNAVVIWFTGFKWDKTVTTLWFLNLAVADFVFVLFLPLYITYVAMNFHWPFGVWLCKANSFIGLLNMFASVFFLTAISLDRYVHLVHPIFSHRRRTLKNTLLVIGAVWLAAALIAGPALYFRDTLEYNNHTICYNNFHQSDPGIVLMRHHALIWLRFAFGYLFPLLTMSICYSCLVLQVKRRSILTSSRHFWTILAVVAAFLVCWTPYHIFSILELSIHHNGHFHDVLQAGIPLSTGFAFLNSCLNPILYVLISKKFQVRFRASVAEILKHTLWEVSWSGTVSEQFRNSENKNLCLLETTQ